MATTNKARRAAGPQKRSPASAACAEGTDVTIERIVQGLSNIAFGATSKDSDRISALEKLGKHLGMFREKVEHDVRVPNFTFKLDTPGRHD